MTRWLWALCLSGCAAWPTIEPDSPRASERGAHSITLVSELTVRFFVDKSGQPLMEETEHRRVRILDEGGEEEGHVAIGYRPGLYDLLSFRARTIAADGTERNFRRSDAVDVPAMPEFVLYSDSRAVVLDAKPNTPGTIFEYEATRVARDWRMSTAAHSFDSAAPTRLARVTVIAPHGWSIEHHAQRELAPTVSDDGREVRWVFERRDLPALTVEPHGPSTDEQATILRIRLRTWLDRGKLVEAPRDARELSAWLQTWTARPTPPSVAELGRSLTRADADPAVRARHLYDWVRENIPYCAVEIGRGGWRPHDADQVLKVRYGDCKDKANLLRGLLAGVGIDAHMVSIYSHHGFPHPFGLAAGLGNFNHAIVAVELPGGRVFADPTTRTVGFGRLPFGDEDADVLVESDDGALAHTPSSNAASNSERIELDLHFERGSLSGRYKLVQSGLAAFKLRQKLIELPEGKRHEAVRSALALPSAWKLSALEDKESDGILEASGQLRVDSPERGQLLPLGSIFEPPLVALSGERKTPFLLGWRRDVVHRVRIALPNATVNPPAAVSIERPFASYSLIFTVEPGALVVERRWHIAEPRVAAADWPALKQLADEIGAAEGKTLLLRTMAK
jgi:hypothetical protein